MKSLDPWIEWLHALVALVRRQRAEAPEPPEASPEAPEPPETRRKPLTADRIHLWLIEAKHNGATHLMVVYDSYEREDYPVPVFPDENVRARYEILNGSNMQRVMEVYNLSMDLESQLQEARAFYF